MRLRALAATGCALAVLAVPATADAATLSSSQAKKLAKAGVLTAKDLPGWEFEKIVASPTDAQDEGALYKCLGLSKPSFAARNLGYDIGGSTGFIDSSADVATSVSKAKAYFAAMQSKKGAGCVKKFLTAQAVHQGVPAAQISMSVKPVPITVAKADKDVAFRITASLGGFPMDGYLIQALVGQTEISVSPLALDGTKPSLAPGKALIEKAVKRVRAL